MEPGFKLGNVNVTLKPPLLLQTLRCRRMSVSSRYS